jgi:penicillin-binding protein 1A
MAYALQGIPLKPIVGLKPEARPAVAAANGAATPSLDLGGPQRPATLTKGAVQALESIEKKAKATSAPGKQTMLEPAAIAGSPGNR